MVRFRCGEAYLEYTIRGLNQAQPMRGAVMDMQSTVTPPSMRGMGVAQVLCDAAFAYAVKEEHRVMPTCSYIRDRYVPKHLEKVGDIIFKTT
jgi:predicted GNAT family acetyltransferase